MNAAEKWCVEHGMKLAPAPDPKFTAWMAKVDAAIARKCAGLTSSDLPDFMYCDAFEDGATPAQAAKAAIAAAAE